VTSHDDGATPLRTMLRRWPVTLALLALGAGGGAAFAATQPTVYTAESRLAVGGSQLAPYLIPGWATATKEMASNFARYLAPEEVLQTLPPAQRADARSVSASPVPESNIILVEASGTSRAAALAAADHGARTLLTLSDRVVAAGQSDETLADYTAIGRKIELTEQKRVAAQKKVDDLQRRDGGARELTAAREALANLGAEMSTLQMQQTALSARYQGLVTGPVQNRLTQVRAPIVVRDNDLSRMQMDVFGGLVVGGVLALGSTYLRRPRRRDGVALPTVLPAVGVRSEDTDAKAREWRALVDLDDPADRDRAVHGKTPHR
jgi:hypothetical protein